MADSQPHFSTTMRPNIQITHTLNGRVKDFAAAWGLNIDEAYRILIEAGLDAKHPEEVQTETDGSGKPMEFGDCPWCGDPVGDVENARWHLENCPE